MRRSTRTSIALVAAALVLTACGSDESDPSSGSSESDDAAGLTAVTMGIQPIASSAVFELGIDEGIFEDHGIDLELQTGQGGSALIPAVLSGDNDFAMSNPFSVMQALDQGLSLRVVTGFSSHPTEAPDIAGIYSLAGSGIDSPEDLEGHSVAVNTLGVQAEFTIREVVAQHGGDPDQVNFVELGFPDMLAALDSGSVDAVWEVEPFVTMAEDAGYHLVSYNYLETIAGAPSNVIIASENGAAQDSDLMDRMTAAIDEATEFAQENPDQVREVLTTTLELDDDLAQRIAMEQFGRCPSREALESIAALAMDNNALSEEPDVDAFIPEGC